METEALELVYRLRYLFDFGSGICLWAGDDRTHADFDYPIHSSKLPITATLQHRIEFVLAWYDTFLDWDHPPAQTQWSSTERAAFNQSAQEVLALLRAQLGPKFEIIDQSGTG